ncbi:phospholipase A2 [Sergentomyia squamirostris]
MKSDFSALYFLLILRASIARATLFDFLPFAESTKNSDRYFTVDKERNFTQYDFTPYGSHDINHITIDDDFTPSFSSLPSTPTTSYGPRSYIQDTYNTLPVYDKYRDHNQYNVYRNQYYVPKLNPFDEFLQKFRKNIDQFRPFAKKKPISPKYYVHKATTTGLDVNLSFANGLLDNFMDRIKAVYPGTLWCGGGDLAKGSNDLGLFALTDSCCKMHDQCALYIRPRTQLYGLKNGGLFTRSHCDCDREFYFCLKRINTFISNKIGYTYFNILGPQCFREEYPVLTCAKRHRNRCYSYLVDNEDSKTWQWFDNKLY